MASGRPMKPPEIRAREVLHGDIGEASLNPDLINGDDVAVMKVRGEPGLIHKELDEPGLGLQVRQDALDGQMPREALDPVPTREEDLRRATGGDLAEQGVRAEGARGVRTSAGAS